MGKKKKETNLYLEALLEKRMEGVKASPAEIREIKKLSPITLTEEEAKKLVKIKKIAGEYLYLFYKDKPIKKALTEIEVKIKQEKKETRERAAIISLCKLKERGLESL